MLKTCICYREYPLLLPEEMCVLEWKDRNKQPDRLTLLGQIPVTRRLNSRHCFLSSVQPENFPAKVLRCSEWRMRLRNKSRIEIINFQEELAKGYDSPWTTCSCLNRLRTGYTCSKAQRKKWKLHTGDTTCACGKAEKNAAHMLQYSQLAHPCYLDDLIMFNDVGKQCAELWKRIV